MTRASDTCSVDLHTLPKEKLRDLFRLVVGEDSRSPNRAYMVRRIREAQALAASHVGHGESEPTAAAAEVAQLASPEVAVQPDYRMLLDAMRAETEGRADRVEAAPPALVGDGDAAEPLRPGGHRPRPLVVSVHVDGVEVSTAQATPEVLATEMLSNPRVESSADASDGVGSRMESTLEQHDPNSLEQEQQVPAVAARASTSANRRGQFKGMTVRQLQAMYAQTVGRKTSSTDEAYLKWKIREANNGKIRVGPPARAGRPGRRSGAAAGGVGRDPSGASGSEERMMILPLRMNASLVRQLDTFWRSRNDRSRMGFVRRALSFYLRHLGAHEVAVAIDAHAGSSGT